jgi:hypothetical protein
MMNLQRYLIVTLFSLFVSITVAQEYVVPEGVTVLTEEQLLNEVVGNTFYTYNWDEYYEPPSEGESRGKLKIKHKRYGLVGGTWSIKGPQFCINYDKLPLSHHGNCFTFAMEGDKVTFYKPDGSIWYSKGGTIKQKKGNPNNL